MTAGIYTPSTIDYRSVGGNELGPIAQDMIAAASRPVETRATNGAALVPSNGNGAAPQGRAVQSMRLRPQELLRYMGQGIYREAYERAMSLSAYLELIDPSDGYNDGLDAFSRLLKVAGIRVNSMPHWGIFAHRFEAFDHDDHTRALVPEWIARQWRRATTGEPFHRAIYVTTDAAVGSAERPFSDTAVARWNRQLAPAIPLDNLIAQTTQIDSDAYRAFYLLDQDPNDFRMVRVAEAAEVPRAKLVGGEQAIRLHKYGRALEASYEVLRRTPIDKVAFHIARLAIQAEVDKVVAVLDVMINGDGNINTAATSYDLTDLDPTTAPGDLTLRGWLAFKMRFQNPYMMTAALAQDLVALNLLLLNTGSSNIPLVTIANASGFGGFTTMNRGLADGVALGWLGDAPANKIVAFDPRFAIERVTEVGSNLQEVDRWVTRQTQVLVMTEVEGYAVIDQNATKILDLAA